MIGKRDSREIIYNSQEGIIFVDSCGTILDINLRAQELLGLTNVSCSGKKLTILSNGMNDWISLIWESLQLEVEYHNEYKKVETDSGLNYIEISTTLARDEYNKLLGIMVILQSREQKQQNRSRLDERKKLKTKAKRVFDYLFDAIITVDKNGIITYVNKGVEDVLKISEEELIGEHYNLLLYYNEVYQQAGISLFEKALKGNQFSNEEIVLLNRAEERKILKGNVIPLYDDSGIILGLSGVFRDITKLKEQEYRQQKWQEKFRAAEKLAVVGEMAAGTAHEIKNPLSAMKGFLQLLETDELNKEKRLEYIDIVKTEITRLEEIVSEFLELTKPSEDSGVQKFCLCNVIEKTISFLKPQFKQFSTNLYVVCNCYPLWIQGDPNKIQQVFINIIKNALEAMVRHGHEDDKNLTIKLYLDPDENVKIIFEDTGPGLPNEILNKLFSPFNTTKKSGTGLGLPVSMQIVQKHQGHLWAENCEHGGARFYIDLPTEEIDYHSNECHDSNKSYCERISCYAETKY